MSGVDINRLGGSSCPSSASRRSCPAVREGSSSRLWCVLPVLPASVKPRENNTSTSSQQPPLFEQSTLSAFISTPATLSSEQEHETRADLPPRASQRLLERAQQEPDLLLHQHPLTIHADDLSCFLLPLPTLFCTFIPALRAALHRRSTSLLLHTSHATAKDHSHRPRCRPSPADKSVRQQQQQQRQVQVQQQQRRSARVRRARYRRLGRDRIDVSGPAMKMAKKMSLTNRATNTIGEMGYSYMQRTTKE
ncbi:hypothetical protein V8E36_006308 [Tilletia maclaganii]